MKQRKNDISTYDVKRIESDFQCTQYIPSMRAMCYQSSYWNAISSTSVCHVKRFLLLMYMCEALFLTSAQCRPPPVTSSSNPSDAACLPTDTMFIRGGKRSGSRSYCVRTAHNTERQIYEELAPPLITTTSPVSVFRRILNIKVTAKNIHLPPDILRGVTGAGRVRKNNRWGHEPRRWSAGLPRWWRR